MTNEKEKQKLLNKLIIKAVEIEQTNVVKFLLKNGADVNTTNELNETPLIISADKGDIDTLNVLLENGADVNASRFLGVTALMNAVHSGNVDTVNVLLEYGANVNAVNTRGKTPLYFAVEMENNVTDSSFELSKQLTALGADIHKVVNGQKIIDMYPDPFKDQMISIFNHRNSTKKVKNRVVERLNEYSDLLKALWESRSAVNPNAEKAIDATIQHRFNQKAPVGFNKFMSQSRRGKGSSTNLGRSKRKYRQSNTPQKKRTKKM